MAADIYGLLKNIFDSLEKQTRTIAQLSEMQLGLSRSQQDILEKNHHLAALQEAYTSNHEHILRYQHQLGEQVRELVNQVMDLQTAKVQLETQLDALYTLHTEEMRALKKSIQELRDGQAPGA
ncbi:MAG: hypothetical protein KF690_12315 [Bacteroidetes bacterium]|nr:hypothetical protein [Bacteroidota bacterium]